MERGSGSGQSSSTLGKSNYDPQQIVGWVRDASPNDITEVGKALFARISNLDQTGQKMFFDQLNKDPSTSKLLQQYTHA